MRAPSHYASEPVEKVGGFHFQFVISGLIILDCLMFVRLHVIAWFLFFLDSPLFGNSDGYWSSFMDGTEESRNRRRKPRHSLECWA